MSQVLTTASHQWATRPDDQRFLSLADLHASVKSRKQQSWTATPPVSELRVVTPGEDTIGIELLDPTHGEKRIVKPTHFAFGQLAQYASAPAAYLRKLPAELAAINLQWGLEHGAMRDDALILAQSNGSDVLRAMTSTSYGRIWDHQVVEAVQKVNTDGRWKIPAASYSTTHPKRATTLYASDRDVFIFLVDDSHPIEIPGEEEPKFRGFMTWNSEVGAAVFGLTTFLYDRVCDNRMIWGATNIQELRIRHTGGAPERFAYEGAKYLNKYSNEATGQIVDQIVKAKRVEPELESKDSDGISGWLQKRGFSKAVAKGSVDAMVSEGRDGRDLWSIISGVTAYARTITHTDERVTLESKAGKLMDLAA